MRTLTRTLIALPAAATFVALFAATSYVGPPETITSTSFGTEIALDDQGEHFGVVRFTLDEGRLAGSDHQIRIEVFGDDVRRSLEVIDPGNPGAGPTRVRDSLAIVHHITAACPAGRPCVADVPLVFIGRPGRTDVVDFRVGVESWDPWADEPEPMDAPIDEEGAPLAEMTLTAEWMADDAD